MPIKKNAADEKKETPRVASKKTTKKKSAKKPASTAKAKKNAPAKTKVTEKGSQTAGAKSSSIKKLSASKKSSVRKETTHAERPMSAQALKKIASAASGKTLIVVESPTKAKTLSKILGSGYVLKASIGHIIDLPKSRLAIDIENNFKPEYILVKGKSSLKKELQAAAESAKRVLLASDPDREGEAIAWHLAEMLGVDPAENCRIRYHEITADAVKNAVKSPSPIDMNRVEAQQARRILDRLVGYTLSPLLWKKIRRGLSAGRVQSVALAILCERENEIESFTPKDYWNIFALASSPDGRSYKLHVEKENGVSLMTDGKTLAIDTVKKAAKIESVLKNKPLIVRGFNAKKNSRKQPAPFKTSTMQQMAASRLGFSPRVTMRVAQSLFEGVAIPGHGTVGLITYMRTDSLRMAPEALAQARKVIQKYWGEKYLPAKAVNYQAGANAQDAHEAIRPTNFTLLPKSIKSSLTAEQYKLYDMIWRRSVASQMSPAVVNLATLECECGVYGLRAQGTSVVFDGWGAVWGLDVKDTILPPAKEGEKLDVDDVQSKKEQTKPPSRYTESSLINTLEDDGIGRPSTYATIVETLYDRSYVTREEGRKLKPTELGRSVNAFLLDHFDAKSPSPIVNAGFTSSMETSLDQVESGEKNWVELVSQFWTPFTKAITEAEKAPRVTIASEATGETCPLCGKPLVKRQGRFGEFIGCSGYPDCRYIKPVQKKIGVPCPRCGEEHGGEIVQRKSKKGRTFFGCSRYPDCDYVSWNKPAAQKCPVCGGLMEYRTGSKTPVCTQCGHKGDA